ncbi:holo-ACP synthase [Microbacterium aoyamense]|uniref:Holo-[acyl-carrier-protein] synthase n=1 Tax=Microbacterium aoyamense TaxID=344166 RepID=A0ABP5APU7_9MICO|nr:holo-ACP synthase [Microbacterium aoyamense]
MTPAGVRVGCDLQSVSEVAESIATGGDRYLDRILTTEETVLFERRESDSARADFVAGRFAAKEAVFKLLGASASAAVPWTDIEVLALDSGAPHVRLLAGAAALADSAGLEAIDVSISHSGGIAFAVAVAVVAATQG